ncbi:MAG: hypothetical protein M1457_04740, partial [bacterium]|nr:hypothetical protein [bacterium]
LNWQTIEATAGGLRVAWRIYVPAGADPVEVWDVRVEDAAGPGVSTGPRRVSLFACVSMKCDGEDLDCGELYRIARYDPALEAVFVRMDAERHKTMDFPFHNGFATARPAPASWDASPGPFFGARRTAANPAAVEAGACSGSRQAMWPPVAALHVRLEVPAAGGAAVSGAGGGDGAEARFLIGACDGEPMIAALRAKYLGGSLAADPHFDATVAAQCALTAGLRLATPEPTVDRMLNDWVPRQIHQGATWGRWGWRGYRDTLQQTVGVLSYDAALARANIFEACAHQYGDGFALRGWRPIDAKRYADSAQWLIPAVTEYLKETGDFGLLDAAAPFYGGEGGGGAGGREAAPVWAHLERAMARLHEDRGVHGLCLAFGGDWNDSLTGVCRAGRGESAWLSMAFCRDALLMAELAVRLCRSAEARRYETWHGELADAVNRHAWDGEWYLCAFDDDGNKIGSRENDEGRIFLNMQSWAQLGGILERAGDGDARWASAWAAVERHLDTGWGLLLNWPAYTRPHDNVGRLSYVRPGAAENASVYTHGNAFMFAALLERGLADRALRLWRDILPGNPARPGACQPNVFFNGFYGPDSEIMPGLADHAWMTGSCAWMHYGIVELMLGLRRTYDGLVIRPCLPSAWDQARLIRIYRGVVYDITILNAGKQQAAPVAELRVDGRPHPPAQPLPLEGTRHEVVVTLARQACHRQSTAE